MRRAHVSNPMQGKFRKGDHVCFTLNFPITITGELGPGKVDLEGTFVSAMRHSNAGAVRVRVPGSGVITVSGYKLRPCGE